MIGGIISGTAGLIGSVGGLFQGKKAREQHGDIASENLAHQQEVHSWNKQMQERSWDREDTATQRRAADLQGAGLSKTLAAGSAAGSSSPMKLDAPQRSHAEADASQNQAQNWFNLATQSQSIARTQEQIKMIKQQRETEKAKTRIANSNANSQDLRNSQEMLALQNRRELDLFAIEAAEYSNRFARRTLDNRVEQERFKTLTADYVAQRTGWEATKKELESILTARQIDELRHNLNIFQRMQIPTNWHPTGDAGALLLGSTMVTGAGEQLYNKMRGE